MDTRSRKSKSGKFKVNIIVLAIIALISVGVVSSYPTVDKSGMIDENKVKTEEFAEYISNQLYPIYYNMKMRIDGNISEPSDLFLDDKKIDEILKDNVISDNIDDYYYEYGGDDYDEYRDKYDEYNNLDKTKEMSEEEKKAIERYLVREGFNYDMKSFTESELIEYDGFNVVNIESYDKTNKKSSQYGNNINTYGSNDTKVLRETFLNTKLTELKKEVELGNMTQDYMFCAILDFDKDGNLNIPYIKGMNENRLKSEINNKLNENKTTISILEKKYTGEDYVYKAPKIKDTIITIGVIGDTNKLRANIGLLSPGDGSNLSSILTNNVKFSIGKILTVGLALCVVLFIIGFVISKNIRGKILGVRTLVNIPIEIALFILCMIAGLLMAATIPVMEIANVNVYSISAWINIPQLSEEVISLLVGLVNIIYWFILFMFCIISGAYIREMISKDNRETIKRKSLIVKPIRWIIKQIKMFVHWIENLDLKKGLDKPLLIIVGINLLCITIMCIFWGLGIIIAIIYSILLFRFMKSKATSVHRDYLRLEEMTENIADGNFNMDTKEDLGIFNPIKENLGNIQTGFKRAVDEEVKSQRMKTELITNVSHDLKTPLTSIITYVDLLKKEGITDEEKAKYIDVIDRKSQRLKYLIEDLFEVSRSTSGNIELNPVDVDVVSLVKQTVFELDDKIAASGVEIRTRFSNEKIIARLDSMRTFRIFSNLISNISKYSMYGSRAYIEVEDMGDKVSIEFKNISAEEIDGDVENLSERFVRGDKSRNTEGSGLGLAIAKSFTELQGGTFKLSSDGDLFKVRVVFPKKSTIENNKK